MLEKDTTDREPEKDASAEEGEGKLEKYQEMVGNSRALFVLSLSAKEVGGENKAFRPTSYGSLDIRGLMGGGHASTIAAAELAQYFPELKIVTNTREKDKEQTIAEIYAKELERLGVPAEQIMLQENSTNTLTELVEIVKMARKNNWEEVSVLSSETHTERIQAFIDHLEETAENCKAADAEFVEAWEYFEKGKKLQIHVLSAEQILPLRDERYEKIIEEVRKSEAYEKRVKSERRGIDDIKEGIYGREKPK